MTSINPELSRALDACAAPDSADPDVPDSGPEHRKAAWAGGVKLRLKHRRSEPTGRPHSWHSTKLGENQPEAMMQISQGTIGTPWPQGYHSSSSTSDLSSYDHAYLRHSPDQCSSQGSMESLEPSGGYPACHLLSPAKSTSSIDQLGHLHSKRDSAYSSFSTSSSILEYPPPGTAARERSGSMDTVSARGGLLEGMRHADIRYVKTVYDPRRGVSAEYEVNSAALHTQGREARATADGQAYDRWAGGTPRSKGAPPPAWGQQQGPGAPETASDPLPPKVGAPLPPARSDSFAAFRHRERPNSWSSLEHKRFCRPPATPSGLKPAFLEEQLHTVVEKSPESSPPARPRGHGHAHKAQPGQPLLPTGIYPVPSPEPHFAHVPQPSGGANGTLYPALAKESGYAGPPPRDKLAARDEHGAQNGAGRPGFAFYQPLEPNPLAPEERKPEAAAAKYVPYKVHFPSVPENEEDASPERPAAPRGERRAPGHSPYSGHHALRSPPAGAWQLAEDQRPPRAAEPWEGPGPEDPDAHPPRRPAREGPAQSPPGHFGGRPAFSSSLQNIPDSLRRLSCPEAGDGAREAGRKAGAELRSHPDGPVSYPRPEGRAGPLAAFPSAEPGCEEPSGPGRRQPQRAVLEKVSRIEQREQGQRGAAAVGPHYRPQRALSSAAADLDDAAEPGAEDAAAAATRQPARREPLRPAGRLLRSVSTFQLCGDDEPPAPDAPFSRDYRNSIKDAQCRVLGATSFRRRDLEPAAPAPRVWRPRPLSAHVGLRSPDAPPTPAAAATASPHTPRERHSVTPADGDAPAGDPGRPVPARRGPRRRLTAEQKKRSYSEPERMNEVGIADDAERPPRAPDGSVADRRRLFERDAPAWPARSLTGPELKQFQQSALADYIQRKTGRRPAAPDGPGLAPAASLSSLLREPRREPPAARDRSSSFAGGRFIRDWRRELPGGPQGAPGPDRRAAEPGAPWARRAAKSMSAEDLLERSDALAVPVHVRSRSSPIAEKRQDTLLGESNGFGFVKDPCRLAEYRSRSLGGAERGQEEMPVFRRRGGSGDGLLDQPRHARPLPTGMPGHGADPRAVPCSPAAEEPPPPYTPASSHRSNSHGLAQPPCPEQGVPAPRRRVSLPQRPPPSRVKWAPAVSLPEEPDTPGGPARAPGRVSLRISESLQVSPPPREDYEDEVFAGDSHPNATSSPTFETLPPPPPPPPLPPLSQEALDGSVEDFPPPPPQALLEAPPDGGDYLEPRSSSSTFAKVTVAKERPVPGTAHVAGGQTLPSRSQASAEGSEALEASSLDFVPPRDSPAGPKPSPGSAPAVQSRNLGPQPATGIENLEGNASPAPRKSSEDIRTEVLAKEIVHQDRSLADILDPDSRMKTTMDLMEGLFPRDSQLLKENGVKRKTVLGTADHPGYEGKRSQDKEAGGVLLDCPTYYSVSAQKAELLSIIRDMPEEASEDDEQADVNEKKAELIGSLTHKLESLQEAKRSLLTDIQLNNALGEEVEALISQRCKPNEFDKYKMFIGDLDKVVNLLLSLSGRLARVENVLSSLGDDASSEERNSLNEKRKVLAGQHEDARELKENLDRRERLVWAILASYLSEEQLLDYQHFVKMKSTLLIEQRKLDDKIKLGQEQVKCLLESLPANFTPRAGGPTLPASRQAGPAPAPSEGGIPGGPPAAATPL